MFTVLCSNQINDNGDDDDDKDGDDTDDVDAADDDDDDDCDGLHSNRRVLRGLKYPPQPHQSKQGSGFKARISVE